MLSGITIAFGNDDLCRAQYRETILALENVFSTGVLPSKFIAEQSSETKETDYNQFLIGCLQKVDPLFLGLLFHNSMFVL